MSDDELSRQIHEVVTEGKRIAAKCALQEVKNETVRRLGKLGRMDDKHFSCNDILDIVESVESII